MPSNRPMQAMQSSVCTSGMTPTANYSSNNRLSSGLYDYDQAGDVVVDPHNQCLYDAEGRICAVAGRQRTRRDHHDGISLRCRWNTSLQGRHPGLELQPDDQPVRHHQRLHSWSRRRACQRINDVERNDGLSLAELALMSDLFP